MIVSNLMIKLFSGFKELLERRADAPRKLFLNEKRMRGGQMMINRMEPMPARVVRSAAANNFVFSRRRRKKKVMNNFLRSNKFVNFGLFAAAEKWEAKSS